MYIYFTELVMCKTVVVEVMSRMKRQKGVMMEVLGKGNKNETNPKDLHH